MLLQELQRQLQIALWNHDAEAAAHVEDLAHLLVGDAAVLLDQAEDRGDGERVVDLVADLGGEPQQVLGAAGGDVGEAADLDLGAQQLDDRLDVDLGRLEQHLAEWAAEAVVVERDLGQRRARQRVAVGVQAGGGEADDDVAGLDRGAVDDRVEGDGPEAGAGDVDAAHQLAELGELAAGDLDPRQLGAPR